MHVTRRTLGALLVVYVAWGATYPAIRVMVETVPPLIGTGARFLVAGAILAAVLGRRMRATRRELAAAALIGTVILGDIGVLALAEQEVPAGLAALVIASVPVWIAVLRFAHLEPVERTTVAAVILGLAGVAVLVLPGERAGGAPLAWLLVLVAAAVVEAAGQFYSPRAPLPADAPASTAIQLLAAGAVLMLVGAVAGEEVELERFSPESVLAFAYLVVPGSLLAYSAFVWLLANAPISLVSTYAYVNPLVAVFLGWALLSEEVTATLAAGACAIVASVALLVRRAPRVRAMADEEAEFEILSEEGETPDEHDVEILETLEEHGEDLSEPREIRVDLLFPDEESANAAEEELTELGYEVAGFEAAGEEEQWSLRATRELRVDHDNVTGFRHRFEELAARHGGEFDGWEAAAD